MTKSLPRICSDYCIGLFIPALGRAGMSPVMSSTASEPIKQASVSFEIVETPSEDQVTHPIFYTKTGKEEIA